MRIGSNPNCAESVRNERFDPKERGIGDESDPGPEGEETLVVSMKRSTLVALRVLEKKSSIEIRIK
jgi:hypothetical protein